jgi:branched-chain amino acid transport system permease protein
MRQTPYWRGVLGLVILVLVLVFPGGIAGTMAHWVKRRRR